MKQSSYSASDFHFELSANGEQTTFTEVDGMTTEVISSHLLKSGDNPFKFKLPSPPKTGNLILKKGSSQANSKLMQWCSGKSDAVSEMPTRTNVALKLKDAQGNSLVEWTFHNAQPIASKSSAPAPKTNKTEIENLELKYSFYTFTKK